MGAIGHHTPFTVDKTTEGRAFAVGERFCREDGSEYLYVQASSAIALHDVVEVAVGNTAAPITTAVSRIGLRVAVAQVAIADNEWGWVQIYGPCTINVETGAAANSKLNTTTTGGQVGTTGGAGRKTLLGVVTTEAESGNKAAGLIASYPFVDAEL